jgi:hypothetical protein
MTPVPGVHAPTTFPPFGVEPVGQKFKLVKLTVAHPLPPKLPVMGVATTASGNPQAIRVSIPSFFMFNILLLIPTLRRKPL